MKCRNCGAQLDLDTRFCPNCGSPNTQAQKHIRDMDKYKRKFSQTKTQVVSNSKWFIKYITPITTLTLSVIICALAYAFSGMSIWYDITDAYQKSYNKSHAKEISDNTKQLLDEGRYQAVYYLSMNINRKAAPYNGKEWYHFYNITDCYIRLRSSILADFDPAMKGTYNADQAVSRAAENIEYIENAIKRIPSSYSKPSQEALEHIKRIQNEMNLFLKAYCGLTDEDIEMLPQMDRKTIITLLVGRMGDEKD